MLRGNRRLGVLLLILAVSTGFGFLKQAKYVWRNRAAYGAPHHDADHAYLSFKNILIERHGRAGAARLSLSYLSDRTNAPGKRDSEEFFHDVQYAFVPLLIDPQRAAADYYLLDFETEAALDRFCADRGLKIIARNGAFALAQDTSR